MGEREITSIETSSSRATAEAAATAAIVQEYPLIKIRIDELVFDPSNPNVMTDEQIIGLRKSMQKFGYLTPIVIDLNNNIADGEHRALIYKELGLEEIPAIKMKLETDADRRELRQVLNKLHGFHDKTKDADELVQIFQAQKLDELAELIAQPKEDLQRLMLRYHPGLEFVTPENEEEIDKLIDDELKRIAPDTSLGDIWQLDTHKIACGDCTDAELMKKLLGDDKVNQLNCDPPYGVHYGDKNRDINQMDGGNRLEEQYANDDPDFDYHEMFNNMFKIIPWNESGNTVYIWSGGKYMHEIRLACRDSDIHVGAYLVWVKNNHVFSGGRNDYNSKHENCIYGWHGRHIFYGPFRTTVLEYDKPLHNNLHPTMKPIELIHQTITDGSKEGAIILDTFAGAGSSLIVSEMTGRRWRGIEIDPHYVDICIKRWEKYTGKKAVKVS